MILFPFCNRNQTCSLINSIGAVVFFCSTVYFARPSPFKTLNRQRLNWLLLSLSKNYDIKWTQKWENGEFFETILLDRTFGLIE